MTRQGAYVVTTLVDGISRAQIWNASSPLTLGHPLKWILERTPRGLRARNLEGAAEAGSAPKEVPTDVLAATPEGTELQLSSRITLKIKPVRGFDPAFDSNDTGDSLTAFSCFGQSANWIADSTRVGQQYSAELNGESVFTLRKQGDSYQLIAICDGLVLSNSADCSQRPLQKGGALQLKDSELAHSLIDLNNGAHRWKFGLLKTHAASEISQDEVRDAETEWFKKAVQYAVVGLGAFTIMAWVWPKPKVVDELIPAQFAKIVMAQPKKATAVAEESAGSSTPKKAQDAKLVQAFRAKALRNSINGLLKGGMSRLLAQSDFVMGATGTAEARRIFDSKTTALQATGTEVGLMNAKNVKVAQLGGGSGEGTGAVGYGKGHHAAIQGQGTSHVSLDLVNSLVQEGLTKDEVGEVIHRHLSEVRYCYEAAMLRNPGVEGRLIVNFSIGGTGSVKTSEVKTSTLPDPRLDDCILRRLVTWRFPQTKGGVDVAVTYPFIFKTLGR